MEVNFFQKPEDCIKGKDAFDTTEYYKALEKINNSSISEEKKSFFRLAACRLIEFNYDIIAKEYFDSTEEEKQLYKDLYLVILDKDDAIRNGYTNLSKFIEENLFDFGDE